MFDLILVGTVHLDPEGRRGHPGLKLLKLQLHTPFEWEVAHRYSKANNIPFTKTHAPLVLAL